MRKGHRFRPETPTALEDRLVLHRGWQATSVIVSGLYPYRQALRRGHVPIDAEVNKAFDAFTLDYAQARAAYYASLASGAMGDMGAETAFRNYTDQRVNVLAQQVVSSFLQTPKAAARVHNNGMDNALRTLVDRRLTGTENTSLAVALKANIPTALAAPSTTTLYSLAQDNAIESARVSVLNGVNIIRNGDFGNKKARWF